MFDDLVFQTPLLHLVFLSVSSVVVTVTVLCVASAPPSVLLSYSYIIEYGHEAKPSILGLQIVFLAAPRDDYDYGDYGASQEL